MLSLRIAALSSGAALAACAILFAACSSTDESTAPEPTSDTATADTSVPLSKACDNPADRDAVFGRYCPGDLTFKQLNSECAIECLLKRDAEAPTCVFDCLKMRTNGAMSNPCLTCYDGVIACARANCVAECAGNSFSEKCTACMCGDNLKSVNCYKPLNECSGLGFTFCEDLDAGKYDAAVPINDARACGDVVIDAATDTPMDAATDTRMDAKADVKTDTPKG